MTSPNNKRIALVIGLVVLAYGAYWCQQNTEIREGFGMLPTRTVLKDTVKQVGPQKGDFVSIPGTFQSSLSPIGGAGMVDYGANIRYNMPANGHLHTADYKNSFPIVYANDVAPREGYCGSKAGCRGNGSTPSAPDPISNLVPSNFASGNFNQKIDDLKYTEVTDMLPVQNMGGQIINELGEEQVQPIIYDRFIYANQKSRLYALADPIRGDLPIVPSNTGWFQVNVHPQIDLQAGAMAVMGGINNSTSAQLLALQSAAAGNLVDTGSGINFAVQNSQFSSNAGSDIQVTSFP